ncbi:hypothetical protein [Sinomonas sp.]|uniref:hypothetical protein n=1 Tax=Sinomonas sp. TaxID=1914986 RepID=UPI002FE2CB51
MQSLGSQHPASTRSGMRISTLGLSVLVLAFLVAVIFAANRNEVIGWIVAVISLAWLVFAVFVFVSVRNAGRRAQAKFEEAALRLGGRAPSMAGQQVAGEARTVDDARDLKLDHSFKIIQVQERVVRENLGKDPEQVARALETIQITAANARDMLRPDGGEPVTGTVVDEG